MREAEHIDGAEDETADALPVLAKDVQIVPATQPRSAKAAVRRVRGASLPTVQVAAAAGGLVAGAAVLGLVQRRNRAGAALAKGARRRALGRRATPAQTVATETLQVVSSRTFLVDVHVLGAPGADG